MLSKLLCAVGVATILVACARSSGTLDNGDGSFSIVTHASLVRGGVTGAAKRAYLDAQKFCTKHEPGSHVVVVGQTTGDASLGFGGNADLKFRCAT